MKIEQAVRLFAGIMILLSVIMNIYFPNGYWLYLIAFIGFNLFQSAITKFCPAEIIISKLFFSKK